MSDDASAAHGRSTHVRRRVQLRSTPAGPDHRPETRAAVTGDADSAATWNIPVETPVEISLNGSPWTVMLATPADLEDLAAGLAFTEGVLKDPSAVRAVRVNNYLEGIAVDLQVPASALDQARLQKRALAGRSGCGLCGVESLAALPLRQRNTGQVVNAVSDAAIRHALHALNEAQVLNRLTHSVHGAAWCDLSGRLQDIREDVGRHNALDKLIGARLRSHRLAAGATPAAAGPAAGFIAMTSRCSFELVYKAAAAGAALLVTISAPTSLALQYSAQLQLPLACTGRADEVVRFLDAPGNSNG